MITVHLLNLHSNNPVSIHDDPGHCGEPDLVRGAGGEIAPIESWADEVCLPFDLIRRRTPPQGGGGEPSKQNQEPAVEPEGGAEATLPADQGLSGSCKNIFFLTFKYFVFIFSS